MGVGLKYTDEVIRYVSLNLLGVYLGDMGNQMNMGLDVMLIDTLINGDGNANGAATIGVYDTENGITYKDLLRAWIRMSTLGRTPQSILSNEDPALGILTLNEFTNKQIYVPGQPGQPVLNLRTPVPTNANYDIHGAMPATNQIMLIDRNAAVIKYTSDALRMDNARIVEKQIEGTYATMTTGFANLFRDARLIIDASLDYDTYPYPTWMNPYAVQANAGIRNR